MEKSRFIVGLTLIAVAVLILFFAEADYTSGAIGLGVLGLVLVAISRRHRDRQT